MSASSWPEAVPVAASQPEVTEAPRWSLGTRIAFRFLFVFLLLMNLPAPLENIPVVGYSIYDWFASFWSAIVPPMAQAVFGVEADVLNPTGSGDRMADYIHLFISSVAAGVTTLLWSLLDRKALSYPRLHKFLRVYVRFTLAFTMIQYGAIKIIKTQFPMPGLDRLVQPMGEFSPMGLLWTFMGVSTAYNVFTGLGEIVGGLLLTTRRTTLLGALVSAGVLAHIAMLNFSYDVPVKIFSLLLLLMALFLIAPDLKRVAAFFLENRAVRTRKWVLVLRTLIVVGITGMTLYQTSQRQRFMAAEIKPSPLTGLWTVGELVVDSVPRPPLLTDATRWQRVIFSDRGVLTVQTVDGKRTRYRTTVSGGRELKLQRYRIPDAGRLAYLTPNASTLVVDGTVEGKRIHATLQKEDTTKSFLLLNRGFHWITDVPYNR
ncbi:MAG TPA: hypothetical protein VE974_18430 [Thermoanaerobaculia bacterium]|nr:hypothetical protein [Thermoanaerobaculia bacterium]